MVISGKKVCDILNSTFDKPVKNPTDTEFLLTTTEEVDRLIDKFGDKSNYYIKYLWECEEIAMAFVVDVRRYRSKLASSLPEDQRRNLAIGEAQGEMFNGVKKPHHINFFMTDGGVYLLDMQLKKYWKANPKKDDIYFVRL